LRKLSLGSLATSRAEHHIKAMFCDSQLGWSHFNDLLLEMANNLSLGERRVATAALLWPMLDDAVGVCCQRTPLSTMSRFPARQFARHYS
jgi:hypothetical protein